MRDQYIKKYGKIVCWDCHEQGICKKLRWKRIMARHGNVENRGLRTLNDDKMCIFLQKKLGLSAYHDKRRISQDLIHSK